MRVAKLVIVLAVIAAVAASIATAGGPRRPPTRIAAIELTPGTSGGPQGVAYLKQKGNKVSGWFVVWGLPPNTTHAWHIHGPNGACAPASRNKDPIASGTDAVADANGVAFKKVSITIATQIIKRGFYLNVHELSSEAGVGAGITCGNIVATVYR
jgi:Cu/Zn superoxide dismutase